MGKKGRRVIPPRYWHGGVPGLVVGELVVPAVRMAVLPWHYATPTGADTDPTRVYVTGDKELALVYAGRWRPDPNLPEGGGTLYRVEPIGTLSPDPDYHHVPGLSWSCAGARVTAVFQRDVAMTTTREAYGNRFVTWDDGTRMYDDEGYVLPASLMQLAGVTAEDLRLLGRGAAWHEANARAVQLATARGVDLDAVVRAHAEGPEPS